MYTTNTIEGLNRQYRKVTKAKSVFPSDQALEKMLYLASENITKKMDLEIPRMGSGAEPAGCPVRRAADGSFIKRSGWQQPKTCHPILIPSAFILLPEYPILIPEVGCGQSPQKGNKITCLFVMQKDQKRCIDFIQLVIL